MKRNIIALVLLLVSAVPACSQEPAARRGALVRFFGGYAGQLKKQFTDVRRHPVAWGVPFALKMAINFADTGSTCAARANDAHFYEKNPLFGRHPACRTLVLSTVAFTFAAEQPAQHYLSDLWTRSCYADAADPNSRWNRLAARSHDPESCRWNVPYGLLAPEAYHLVIVKNNVGLAERH